MLDYFPLGMARGGAFCNRTEETEQLIHNIKAVRPTLVMSPRRYGKTSLVLHALAKEKVPFAHVDFYKALSEQDIVRVILNGVGQLLAQVESKPKQLLTLAHDFFAQMHIKVGMQKFGLTFEIAEHNRNAADTIQNALEKLHALAKKKKQRFVFFMDEFQRLSEVTDNIAIESALRQVVQMSEHVTYFFSGSNRHLVEGMFYDSNRPFYRSCEVLHLGRIMPEHYEKYFQKAAKVCWQEKLSSETMSAILQVTACHPYYVNLLCSKLWRGKLPTAQIVHEAWRACGEEQRSQIEREIDLLSFNQKKMLMGLSQMGSVKQTATQDFLKKIGMPSASSRQAIKVLLERDYLYRDAEGAYCVMDPLFTEVLG